MSVFSASILCIALCATNTYAYILKIVRAEGELDAYHDLFVLIEDEVTDATIGQTSTIDPLYQNEWNEEFLFDASQEPKLKLFNGDRYDFIGYTVITSEMIQNTDCDHVYAELATLHPWNKAKLFFEFSQCDVAANSAKQDIKNKAVMLILPFASFNVFNLTLFI